MVNRSALSHKWSVCSGLQLFVTCQRLMEKHRFSFSWLITFMQFTAIGWKIDSHTNKSDLQTHLTQPALPRKMQM